MATPYASGESVSWIDYSGLSYIDGLLGGLKWGGALGTGVDLTYSFGGADSVYRAGYGNGELLSGFGSLTSVQQLATNNALQAYANVANISFTEVQDSATVAGDLRFALSDATPTAWAYYPTYAPEGGDVWFSNSVWYDTATPGTYGYMTFLHEIGHALGLEHPHSNNTDLSIDTTRFSVMSYRSYEGAALGGYSQNFFATTPMLHDIAALQYSYGANMSYETGDNTYSWAVGERILETVWDAGGNDTIDWSNQSSDAVINLNDGEYSQLGPAYWSGVGYESQTFAIAYNAVIENANGGSGADTLVGNEYRNQLQGNNGNDTLYGGAGNDVLLGGSGSDVLYGGTSTLSEVAGSAVFEAVVGDFDGDGSQDDILWHRASDGQTFMWEVENSGRESGGATSTSLGVGWVVLGAGDFDGDGKDDDVLWQRISDGQTYVWGIENGDVDAGAVMQGTTNLAWDVVGIGDFDGDGKRDDVLWHRSSDGRIYLRETENGLVVKGSVVKESTDLAWELVGIGDFDGDGKDDDVFWYRNTDGRTYIRNMEDGAIVKGVMLQSSTNSAWQVSGIGDFDGDGKRDDVLWYRASDGRTYIRETENGALVKGSLVASSMDTDWQIEQIGDFDGDGRQNDILWRNTTDGAVQIWNIESSNLAGSGETGNGDILTGGTGDDSFVFNNGDGHGTITDFTAGAGTDDTIDVSDFSFASYNDFMLNVSDDGFDTSIALDSDDNITLIGVRVADLHQDDFALV